MFCYSSTLQQNIILCSHSLGKAFQKVQSYYPLKFDLTSDVCWVAGLFSILQVRLSKTIAMQGMIPNSILL